MKNTLTERQQEIYAFIRKTIAKRGIPPSMRELGEQFAIRSTNGVEGHLAALERGGYITRERGKSRSISLCAEARPPASALVPLLGRVAAGVPTLSPENHEAELAVDLSLFSLRTGKDLFALIVRGESMKDAHIMEGDTLLVRAQSTAKNGEIVVALVDGEATVKRFYQEENGIRLQPENSAMKPLHVQSGEFRIVGKAVGVFRKI